MVIKIFIGNKKLIRDQDIFWFQNSLLMIKIFIGHKLSRFLKGFESSERCIWFFQSF